MPTFCDAPTEEQMQKKFILITYHYPHLAMEFLHSFLRRHFARKPVVESWNVSCFLRLWSRFEAMEKKRRIKFWQIHKSAKTCSEYWGGREQDNWTGIWQVERNVRMGVINRQLQEKWSACQERGTKKKSESPTGLFLSFLFYRKNELLSYLPCEPAIREEEVQQLAAVSYPVYFSVSTT